MDDNERSSAEEPPQRRASAEAVAASGSGVREDRPAPVREEGAGCPSVDATDRTGRCVGEAAWVTRWLGSALRDPTIAARLDGRGGEFRVVIVGDAEMSRLHGVHRGEAVTTDVLTFDLSEPGGGADADIIVCADEAARAAGSRGLSLERELLLYALHGVLHCLGFDDGDEASARAMHEAEDAVLEAIGIGRTFAGGGGAP